MCTYSWVARKAMDLLPVFICQLEGSKLVLLLAHRVSLNDRAEHWEAIFDIEGCIVAIAVDACQTER